MGVSEELSIKINHHQTLETEQLRMGWCSLLSVKLALPLCNPADFRLSLHRKIITCQISARLTGTQLSNCDSRASNINVPVHPEHILHCDA